MTEGRKLYLPVLQGRGADPNRIVTGTGWSLRRFRESALKIGARLVVHARRMTVIVAQSAAPAWSSLWPRLQLLAWPGP